MYIRFTTPKFVFNPPSPIPSLWKSELELLAVAPGLHADRQSPCASKVKAGDSYRGNAPLVRGQRGFPWVDLSAILGRYT